MNQDNVLKNYVKPSTVLVVLAGILAAATLFFGFKGIASPKDTVEEADYFSAVNNPIDTTAYLEVVGCEDWIFQTGEDVFYTVMDDTGLFYIVQMNDSTYHKLSKQHDWYISGEDESTMPEAYLLFGTVRTLTKDIKDAYMQVYEMYEEEVEYYFGSQYLDTTITDKSNESAKWWVFALFSGLFLLLDLVFYFQKANSIKKCLTLLEEEGLYENAERELILSGKQNDNLVITENYLFSKEGILLPFSSIYWIYTRVTKMYGLVSVSKGIVINTKTAKNLNLPIKIKNSDSLVNAIFDKCREKNPFCLIGFTSENRKKYNTDYYKK